MMAYSSTLKGLDHQSSNASAFASIDDASPSDDSSRDHLGEHAVRVTVRRDDEATAVGQPHRGLAEQERLIAFEERTRGFLHGAEVWCTASAAEASLRTKRVPPETSFGNMARRARREGGLREVDLGRAGGPTGPPPGGGVGLSPQLARARPAAKGRAGRALGQRCFSSGGWETSERVSSIFLSQRR